MLIDNEFPCLLRGKNLLLRCCELLFVKHVSDEIVLRVKINVWSTADVRLAFFLHRFPGLLAPSPSDLDLSLVVRACDKQKWSLMQ